MKKVLSALLLTLAVLGLALGAYAEEEADTLMLELNIQAVKANLDDHELHYTQQGDQNDVFKLNYNLDGTLNSGKLWIFVYDDGVRFEADYDVSATEEVRGELLISANSIQSCACAVFIWKRMARSATAIFSIRISRCPRRTFWGIAV